MEHGEFRGNLYGTSVQSVADLAAAGYQPILNPHFQVPIQRESPLPTGDRDLGDS